MGHFEAYSGLYVKKTKCRLDVHTGDAKGSVPPCFRTTPRCGARSLRSLSGGWDLSAV